jgi:voltage-gated sodium channel
LTSGLESLTILIMNKFFQNLAASERFQTFILFLILVTAISMGVETIPDMADAYGGFFLVLHYFAQIVFAFEICVRLLAFTPNFGKFFEDSWNTFDFLIVGASFLPGIGSFALVARLLRVLRVLRVLSVSDHLRGFMDRLKESFDEIACASVIVFVLGYIFIISGHYLFFEVDTAHWGTLGDATMSIFYLLLFQDVQSFVVPLVKASKVYLAFFLLFYFVFVSLYISVITAAVAQSIKGEE